MESAITVDTVSIVIIKHKPLKKLIKMEKEQIIQHIKKIIQKGDENSINKILKFIENLIETIHEDNQTELSKIFNDFVGSDFLNFVSDDDFEKITLEKWNKEQIENWIKSKNEPLELIGVYNLNAIVLAMNYEYFTHKEYIEKIGNEAITAYQLAKSALETKEYITRVLDIYLSE